MVRICKDQYYLEIAKAVGMRATCLHRCYGAVIVNTTGGRDRIVSTGYCGAPRGEQDCFESGVCLREQSFEDGKIIRGQNYSKCISLHGEANAIIQASPLDTQGATIYIYGRVTATGEPAESGPCYYCLRMIKNAGIARIVMGKEDGTYYSREPKEITY